MNISKSSDKEPVTRRVMGIAVLDRERIVLTTLGNFLEDLGHRVIVASSVPELSMRGENTMCAIDAILLSIEMSREEAVKSIVELHELCPDAAIIVISRADLAIPHDVAVENGVYGYMTKPVRLGKLELLLTRLGQWRESR